MHSTAKMLVYTAVLALAASSSTLAQPNPATAIDALCARLQQLQNFTADFTLQENYNPPPAIAAGVGKHLVGGGAIIAVYSGPRTLLEKFYLLDGKARYEEQYAGDRTSGTGVYELYSSVEIYSPERFESLQYKTKNSHPSGIIDNPHKLPLDSLIECAAGVRLEGADHLLTPDDLRAMTLSFLDDDQVVLKAAGPKNRVWVLIFSRKLNYALISYQVLHAPSTQPMRVLANSDFRQVSGVMLPYKIKQSIFNYAGGPAREVKSSTIDVNSYDVGGVTNTDSQYFDTYPVGSIVLDSRTGLTFAIKTKPCTLTDDEIAQIIKEGDAQKKAAQQLINKVLEPSSRPSNQP